MTVPHSFLVFHDLDNFNEIWPVILYNVSQLRFFRCFFMIQLRLYTFGKKCQRSNIAPFSEHSICIITGGINLDHLVQILSTGFVHCRVTDFLFLIDKYLGVTLSQCQYSLSSQTFTLDFSIHWWMLPATVVFANGDLAYLSDGNYFSIFLS